MKKVITVFLFLTSISQLTHSQTKYPLAEDVASPEAIVSATYDVIKRAPGEAYKWDRFLSLFVENAILIPSSEQTGGQFWVISPKEFAAWADRVTTVGGSNDKGFTEDGVHNKIEQYGDIAHVFSTYEKHFWDEEKVIGRGINTFQLVYRNERWWITSIAWDEEVGAGPVPQKYLPKGR